MMDDIRHREENLPQRILSKLRKHRVKGYIYSWNVVKSAAAEEWLLHQKADYPVYHYDLGMCRKYGFAFNTIMYSRHVQLPKQETVFDAVFIGFAKDRETELIEMYKQMTHAGMKVKFCVFESKAETRFDGFEYLDKYLPYAEYLKLINQSRTVLDIAQGGQDGYSMRVMEAIFLDKKLITTNRAVKNAAFYDPAKVLVVDDLTQVTGLEVFCKSPDATYDEKWKHYYSIEAWAERFSS